MLRIGKCVIGAAVLLVLTNPPAQPQTINEYGQECARAIVPIPTFDCQSGTEIAITVDGQIPPFQPGMSCDRPSLLPYNDAGAQGQCVPYSRALVLRDDDRAQIVAACREKVIRPADTFLYDEIDIIAHSVVTGDTCWFQALAPGPLSPSQGLDGRRVPPPDQPAGATFWRAPAETAAERCVDCHDSDPFMYSPFIAQTGQLPKDPFGKYSNDVGAAFKSWPKPSSLATRGNTCIGCHRIGSLSTCTTTMYQAVGLKPIPGSDAWAQQYPQSHWMPPGNPLTERAWDVIYGQSVSALAACCANPKAPGCAVTPIEGSKSPKN
jgi:hypothetical protein